MIATSAKKRGSGPANLVRKTGRMTMTGMHTESGHQGISESLALPGGVTTDRDDFMKDTLKLIAAIAGFVLLLGLVGGCKYKFWRVVHPQAPAWTFFFGG